jgi:chromate transport protein ChrA
MRLAVRALVVLTLSAFGGFATFVPLAENERMELTGQLHQPLWRHDFDESSGLL